MLQQTNKVPQDMKNTIPTKLISFKTLQQGFEVEDIYNGNYSITFDSDTYLTVNMNIYKVVEVEGIKELTPNQEKRAVEMVEDWIKANKEDNSEWWNNESLEYDSQMMGLTSDWHN